MIKDVFRAAAREIIECYPGITASELGRHLRCGRARAVVLLREETGAAAPPAPPEDTEDCVEDPEPAGEPEVVQESQLGRSSALRKATEEDAEVLRRAPAPMRMMQQMTIEFSNDETGTA